MAEGYALTEATYYILLSLVRPRHGYGIMQLTEELSGGRVHLAAGTLYGALSALTDKGWIIQLPSQDDSRRKEYKLTENGLQVLRRETSPEALVGKLAFLCGLRDREEPARPEELLKGFSWEKIKNEDIRIG